MRKPLIAGNWKMFLGVQEGISLVSGLCNESIDYNKVDVCVAPSFTNIYAVSSEVKRLNKPLRIAAQNVYFEDEGAFTGEVSLQMLKSAGSTAVILGHSERRAIFGETDSIINKKVHKVISNNMMAIVCVGELLSEREAGVAVEVVLSQLGKSLSGVTDFKNVVVAYEPVWAIGTGKTASPGDAESMHKSIRSFISSTYGKNIADNIRILYGGSVKPDNIVSLMAEDNIDGALVGGASLKLDSFLKIVNYQI